MALSFSLWSSRNTSCSSRFTKRKTKSQFCYSRKVKYYFLRSTCTAVLRVGLGPDDSFFCPDDRFLCPDDSFSCPDDNFFCPDDNFFLSADKQQMSDTNIFCQDKKKNMMGRQKNRMAGHNENGRRQNSALSGRDW